MRLDSRKELRLTPGFGAQHRGRGGAVHRDGKSEVQGREVRSGTTGRRPDPFSKDSPSSEKAATSAPETGPNAPSSLLCSFHASICFLTHLFAGHGLHFSYNLVFLPLCRCPDPEVKVMSSRSEDRVESCEPHHPPSMSPTVPSPTDTTPIKVLVTVQAGTAHCCLSSRCTHQTVSISMVFQIPPLPHTRHCAGSPGALN